MEKGKIDPRLSIEDTTEDSKYKQTVYETLISEISNLDLQPDSLLIIKATPLASNSHLIQKLRSMLKEKCGFDGVILWLPETATAEQFSIHELEEIVKTLKGEKV